jgi:hypothetical protein
VGAKQNKRRNTAQYGAYRRLDVTVHSYSPGQTGKDGVRACAGARIIPAARDMEGKTQSHHKDLVVDIRALMADGVRDFEGAGGMQRGCRQAGRCIYDV